MSTAHLDPSRLRNLGSQSMEQLLKAFLQSVNIGFARLERAAANGDEESWQQTLTQMAEASQAVTAFRLAELCKEAADLRSSEGEALLYGMQKELLLLKGEIAHTLTV